MIFKSPMDVRRLQRFFFCCWFVLASTMCVANTIPEIVAHAKQCILVVRNIDSDGDVQRTGTGFFVSENGVVLTNYYVIEGASLITATDLRGRRYRFVGMVFEERDADLAALHFAALDCPYLEIEQSESTVEGQHILVGNPDGLQGTVSDGLISAFREQLIQISAPISPGSSGSPVINDEGRVIGVAVAYMEDGQNLNFAIPVGPLRKTLRAGTPQETAAASPRPSPTPHTNALPNFNTSKWPDGRMLIHPDHVIFITYIAHALRLQSGPGTKFQDVTEIPADSRGIAVFYFDRVRDTDASWWCPVEWNGFLGYALENQISP